MGCSGSGPRDRHVRMFKINKERTRSELSYGGVRNMHSIVRQRAIVYIRRDGLSEEVLESWRSSTI
jgi:hypothetical protein